PRRRRPVPRKHVDIGRAAVAAAGGRDFWGRGHYARGWPEHVWRRRLVALTGLLDGDRQEEERNRQGGTHGTSLEGRVDGGAAARPMPSETSRDRAAWRHCARCFAWRRRPRCGASAAEPCSAV